MAIWIMLFATSIGRRFNGKEQNEAQAGAQVNSEASGSWPSKSAVLNSLTSPSSQRTYDHAIREFIEWYCFEPRLAFNKTVVTRYRISLEQQRYASTTINLRLPLSGGWLMRMLIVVSSELEQIQFLLHVSAQTTDRYLGCKQRFHNAANDRIGVEPDSVGSQ
jgi:hypothetical protein